MKKQKLTIFKRKNKLFLKLVGGIFLGVINGFFGGGAGMLAVPILNKFFSLEKRQAHASALFVVLPLSLISGIVYLTKNDIALKNILFVGFGLVVGGAIGGKILKQINPKALKVIFAFLMFFAGLSMVIL